MSGQPSANKFINMFEQNIQKQKQSIHNNQFANKSIGLDTFVVKKNEQITGGKLLGQPVSATLPQKLNNNNIPIVHSVSNQQSTQPKVISVKDRMKMFQQQKIMGNKPIDIKPVIKQQEMPINHNFNNQTKVQQPIIQSKPITDISTSKLIQSIQQQINKPILPHSQIKSNIPDQMSNKIKLFEQMMKKQTQFNDNSVKIAPLPYRMTYQQQASHLIQKQQQQPRQLQNATTFNLQEILENPLIQLHPVLIPEVKSSPPISAQNMSIKQRMKMMQQTLQNTMKKQHQIKQVSQTNTLPPIPPPSIVTQQIPDDTLLKIVRTKSKRKNVPKFDQI